ncbi:MAG: carbonic anhydrase [Hyphomicrobium sp.]
MKQHLLSRRYFLASSPLTVTVSYSVVTTALKPRLAFAEEKISNSPQIKKVSSEEALNRLMNGNKRYANNLSEQKDYSVGRAERVLGQYPIAAILSCSDSRVSPEILFDQGQGDLFVVRLAGNFVDDDGLASLEYAVQFLGVPLIFVLGHTNCGAVGAAIKVVKENTQLPGNLPELIKSLKPAVLKAQKQDPENLLRATTEENVRINVQRLYGDEPIISKALSDKSITVVGGIYDLATGVVQII